MTTLRVREIAVMLLGAYLPGDFGVGFGGAPRARGSRRAASARRWSSLVLASAVLLSGALAPARAAEGDLDGLLDGPAAKQDETPAAEAAPATPATQDPEEPAIGAGDSPGGPDAAGGPARAEATPRVIEEIIVTAQRKEQSLRTVPISLSVVDDEFIQQTNITDFADLSAYVPGVSVNNSSESYFLDVRIRGFGSPIANKAFEQPVGLVIDSIPYGRIGYWQGPLYDLERVEVLRGPQGTLFGKNTTAGLFNVVTKRPTPEFEGILRGELGTLDRRRFEGGIGGPLLPGLLDFRVSALSDERGGYVDNTTARVVPGIAEDLYGSDRKAARVQLALPNLAGAELVVGYDHVESTSESIGWEIRSVAPEQVPFFLEYDPNADFRPGNRVASLDRPGFYETTIDTVTANGRYDVGDWEIHGVAGYTTLRAVTTQDDDLTPGDVIHGGDRDRNPQTTFELRAHSPSLPGFLGLERLFGLALGQSDLVGGFFFQHRKISDGRLDQSLNFPRIIQLLTADATGVVVPCPECSAEEAFETLSVFFEQTTLSYAGFAHLNWYFADRWTLGYGMRFTQEEKEADWDARFTQGTGAALALILNAEEFSTTDDRSEFAFTPKVTLGYDWNDEINFYAGWGTGFRSGGFNAAVFNDNAGTLSYDSEQAESWEVGTKMELLGGTASLNVGLFRQTMTDLQVFSITSETQLLVQNAGEARSQGVETDWMWLPTDWLTLRGTLGYTHAEYLEFPFGGCPADRPDSDGDGDSRCDLSDRPLQFTPNWTATVTPVVRYPLGTIETLRGIVPPPVMAMDLLGSLTVEYVDVHYANENLDPRERHPSFIRLNADLGLGNLAQGWTARIVGQNLTNEDTAARIQQVGVVGRSYAQIVDPPRAVFGELRWEF